MLLKYHAKRRRPLNGSGQAVAPLGTTGGQHLAAAMCFVASAEAELAGAL